jgi:hypothetical protein
MEAEEMEKTEHEQDHAEDAMELLRPRWSDEDPELKEHPWLGVKTIEELGDLGEKEGWDEDDCYSNTVAFSDWENNQRPTTREIEEENWRQKKRWHDFHSTALSLTEALSKAPSVQKVALIGSVAVPLKKEVPRFRKFRVNRVAIFHECKDLDLSVWLDNLTDLNGLRKTIGKALTEMAQRQDINVAPHQVEVFILEPGTDRYLGRLCVFNQCPKGKADCFAAGCGDTPFLKRHEDFRFLPDAIAAGKCQVLFERKRPHGSKSTDDDDLPF